MKPWWYSTTATVAMMVAAALGHADDAAAVSQGRIYWTESQFLNNRLMSMNLDGSDVQSITLPIELFQVFGVAIDDVNSRAFVLHTTVFGKQTTPVDLRNGAILGEGIVHGQPLGLAIERANHSLYWGDVLGSGCGNGVFAFDYVANQQHLLFAGCLKSLTTGPAADPFTGRVYFGWFGQMVSIDAHGSDLQIISPEPIQPSTIALHAEAQHIYWLEADGDIRRMNYDGGDITTVATGVHAPGQGGGLHIDRLIQRMYWIDHAQQAIMSSRLDGSDRRSLYVGPAKMSLGSIDVLTQPGVPGDANGDGAVDVDDLVAVILAWGVCGTAQTTCAADVAPHPQGSGAVDVDDLITVILNWSV